MPLHHELLAHGAWFRGETRTIPSYRLFVLAGEPPARAGLVRVATGGTAIDVEVYRLPRSEVGPLLAGTPAPLCVGTVLLEAGVSAKGFLCEAAGLADATDISEFGGWRAFVDAGDRASTGGQARS